MLKELQVDLKQYQEGRDRLGKAVAGIEKGIAEAELRIAAHTSEMRSLEKQTTSIQPTVDAINSILLRFGFSSFKLAMDDDGKHYKLVRHGGHDARQTLSEGEKTFVVFLYFYHLLKGSMAESGVTVDRVVVFDDPVSSLDSDILFIVSSLIREVHENVRMGVGQIKQVFVLTHNVYFHKEVTYSRNRPRGGVLGEESFWIVRKRDQQSTIERHYVNPIRTSYELLWAEVRHAGARNPWIENTLRRILEQYFTIFGSVDRDEICAYFDGQDQLICGSLFSWVNAGSHHAHDDVYVTPSDAMLENYLRVFRAVFERTGNGGHYRMMMGDAFTESERSEPNKLSSVESTSSAAASMAAESE